MKIGVYGSSFNPVTNGHLWIANFICCRQCLDKVLFLPSSSRRLDKKISIDDRHRVEMLKLAIQNNAYFELNLSEMLASPGKHYSYYTMQTLRKAYPNDELFFIMGADLLPQLPGWTYSERLLKSTKFIVVERQNIPMPVVLNNHPLLAKYKDNFTLVYKGLQNEISSSYIRREFYNGGDPRYLTPENVYQYIMRNRLYNRED